MIAVSSRDNAQIKRFCRLRDKNRERRETGCIVLEGARLCADAAATGTSIETAFVTERALASYPEATEALRAVAAQTLLVSEAVASHMAETEHPQGVFAVAAMPQSSLDIAALPLCGRYLALESVRDPGNLGTIVRTAEAFGIDGLLLSGDCCDLFSPKVLRAAMGGTLRLPFAMIDDLPAAIADWRRQGFETYACVASADAEPLLPGKLGAGCIPVIGNEGNGLTDAAIAACGRRLTIPMAGRAESLNAAVAACIVLWELSRPEDTPHG